MQSQHFQAQQQQQHQQQQPQLQQQQQQLQRQLQQQLQLQALAEYQQHPGLSHGLSQHQAFHGLTVENSSGSTFSAAGPSSDRALAGRIVIHPGMFGANTPVSQPSAINDPAFNNNIHNLANPRQAAAAAAAAANTHAKAARWPHTNAAPSGGASIAQNFLVAGNGTALQPGAAGPSYVPSSQPNSPSNSPIRDASNPDLYGPQAQRQPLAQSQAVQPPQIAQVPQNAYFTVTNPSSSSAPQQAQVPLGQYGNAYGLDALGYARPRNLSPERFNGLGTQNAPIDLTDDFDASEALQAHNAQLQQQQQQQLQLQQLQLHSQQQQQWHQQQNFQEQHQPHFYPQFQPTHHQLYGNTSTSQFHTKFDPTENINSPSSNDSIDPQAVKYLLREPAGQQVDVLISPPRREVTDSFDIVSNASFEDHLRALKVEEPLQYSAQQLQQQYNSFQHLYANAEPSSFSDPSPAGVPSDLPASELFPELFNLRQDFCEQYPKPAAEIAIKSLCGIRASPEAGTSVGRGSLVEDASEVRETTPAQRRAVVQKLRSIANRPFWRHWLDDKRGKQDILYTWVRSLVPQASSEEEGEWTGELYYPDAAELFLLLEELPMQDQDLDKKDLLCRAMRKLIASQTSISARAREVSKHWIDKAQQKGSPEPPSAIALGKKRKADEALDPKSAGSEAAEPGKDINQKNSTNGASDSDDNQPLIHTSPKPKPKPKPINGISTKDKIPAAAGTGPISPSTAKKVSGPDGKEGPPAAKKKKTAPPVDIAAEKAKLKKMLEDVRAKKKAKAERAEQTTLTQSGDQSRPSGTASTTKPKVLVKPPGAASGSKVAAPLPTVKKPLMPSVPKKAVSSTSTGTGLNFFGGSTTSASKPRPGPNAATLGAAKKSASSGPNNKAKAAGSGSTASAGTSLIMDLLSDDRGPKKGSSGAAGRRGFGKAEKEKEKKRVKWRDDADLVAVKIVDRYLDVDEALHDNIVEGGANGLMLQEASMFKSQRSMTEELDWYEPIPLPPLPLPEPGINSTMRYGQAGVWRDHEEDVDGSGPVNSSSATARTSDHARTRTPVSPDSTIIDLPPLEEKDVASASVGDAQAEGATAQTAASSSDTPRVMVEMTIGAELEPFFHDDASARRSSVNNMAGMPSKHMQDSQSGQTSTNGDAAHANAMAFSLDILGIDFSQVQNMLSVTGDPVSGPVPHPGVASGPDGYHTGPIGPPAPFPNGGDPTYDPRPRPHAGGFNPQPYVPPPPPQGHVPGPVPFRGPPPSGSKPGGSKAGLNFSRTEPCIYWKRGFCQRGADCAFRHG